MCVRKVAKTFGLLVFPVFLVAFLCGCEAIDNILSSTDIYKITAQIDGISLEECSYVKSGDKITLEFEDTVSNDPDVTTLMVSFKNSSGDDTGWKGVYTLDPENVKKENAKQNENKTSDGEKTNETSTESKKTFVINNKGNELLISLTNLDDLPPFPMPENLSVGKYTLVLQVMSGKDILQKTEKNIYYLGRTVFSYEGINVYLPGAVDTSHLVPKESVVMLEAKLNFDSRLNPYIIWYDGKNKISEGKFSDGAGSLFWKAPEQNGFFSLCAEVFPAEKSEELSGYKKEISLLVSSNVKDINLVSANIEQLTHWYTMESNLNDSKNIASAENALKPGSKNKPKWMGADGTYGLATGYNNILKLPKISILNKDTETWQVLFRFKPLSNDIIFSAKFGNSSDVSMFLSIEEKNLILTLKSQQKTVSQTVSLPTESDESSENIEERKELSFLTAGIKFSIKSGILSAQINIFGELNPVELATKPITLETKIKNEFNIILGFTDDSSLVRGKTTGDESESSAKQKEVNASAEYNVLWDEFALYYMPPADILTAAFKQVTSEDQPLIISKR
ncbi:MAG: hypothetical protein FWF68_03475 [Spirochaetes bacterium]|nr:hypothetical protein [Spirochaetota bacterium]